MTHPALIALAAVISVMSAPGAYALTAPEDPTSTGFAQSVDAASTATVWFVVVAAALAAVALAVVSFRMGSRSGREHAFEAAASGGAPAFG